MVVWERSETSSRERKTRRRTILAHFEATTESGELVQEFGDSRRQFKFFGGHGVLAIPKSVVTDDAPDDANDDGK